MKKLILPAIVGIALFLRFYKITTLHCMNWDEASFLYNAYSIAETLRDEYGKLLPIQFQSVGDYKFPLFIYMMAPLAKLLGPDILVVRLLPSLFGAISVYVIYKLAKLITKSDTTALVAALLLAISPWHLQFSRAGADIGVSTFFTLFGVYLFLSAVIDKKPLVPSVLAFAISLYTYFGERIFIPLFIFSAIWYFRRGIKKVNRAVVSAAVFGVLLLPAIFTTFSSGDQEKFFKTTIFGYERNTEYVERLKNEDQAGFSFDLFHNSTTDIVFAFADHYLNHFSPGFLFVSGPTDARQFIINMGMLYLFELPLLIVGLSSLDTRNKRFLILWLLLSPIPSAITRDTVHARRSLNMIYPLVIVSAIGLSQIILSKKHKLKTVFLAAFVPIAAYSVGFYFLSYYVFTPLRTEVGSAGWQCGYKELVESISPVKDNYKKVVVDTSYQGPYIFFLVYGKYPPGNYQPQATLIQESKDGLGEGAGYDNYEFRPIYWPNDRGEPNTLYAGPPERIPDKDISDPNKLVKKIYFKNGEVSWVIVETPNSLPGE